jgi:trehalose/maltose hydrolase-like predicted phosphorylase
MTRVPAAGSTDLLIKPSPARRFEAIVFDWDGTAAPDRDPPATRPGRLIEDACAVGIELAIVSGADIADLDGRLRARPLGPGALVLLPHRGAQAYEVDEHGPRRLQRIMDESESAGWIVRWLWQRGIATNQVLGSGSLAGGLETLTSVLADQIARRSAGELPILDPDPAWKFAIEGVDPLLERVRESLLTLADGRLGTRGSALIEQPGSDPAVLMSGVYAGRGAETHLLPAPRWNVIASVDATTDQVDRVLDLHAGVLHQRVGSGSARLEALLLSSLARPATAVLRVVAHGWSLRAAAALSPPGAAHEDGETDDGCVWMRVTGPPGSIAAAAHEDLQDRNGNRVLDRIAAYEGSAHGDADPRVAVDRLQIARELGFDRLLCEHRRAWASRWEDADVRIDGDPELQLAARFAIFHLLASAPEQDEAAIGARGLSGNAYRGHVFWDSDVYVLPFLAATRPRAARALLEYRVRRLRVAIRTARRHGLAGARFPWESAMSGREVTPARTRDGRGEMRPVLTGALEEHIIADVAWAAACYIDWTGDAEFAAGPGRELIVQTARWWASRIETDEHGRGHIRDVIGPDEYHEHVDDNAFTNVMARWNLRRAAAVATGVVDDGERRTWLELAEMIVDGYEPATGVYEQFAGFHSLEPLLIAQLAPHRPVSADILLGPERTGAAQVVKQPDVLMLHYLIPDEVAPGSLDANLDFYEPRTAHGSTLSPGVHAVLLARAGRTRHALELLRLTAGIDLDDIGHMTAGGLHLAAMGGVWRALALGFAGLRPVGDALAIDPVLPPGWEALDLRVRFRDSRVRVRVHPDSVELTADPAVRAIDPSGESVQLRPTAQTFELRPPSSTRLP